MINKNQTAFTELEDFMLILCYKKMSVVDITAAHEEIKSEFGWVSRTQKAIERRIDRLKKFGIINPKNIRSNI